MFPSVFGSEVKAVDIQIQHLVIPSRSNWRRKSLAWPDLRTCDNEINSLLLVEPENNNYLRDEC